MSQKYSQEIQVFRYRSALDRSYFVSVKGHYWCGTCSCRHQSENTNLFSIPTLRFCKEISYLSNCSTKMRIYLLTCKCSLMCVRCTWCNLLSHISEHKSRIRNRVMEALIVQHLVESYHISNDFNFVVLEKITHKGDNRKGLYRILLQCEIYWIFRVYTLAPEGLNNDIAYLVFL